MTRYWIADAAGIKLLKENGMWLHLPLIPGDSRHLLTFASLANALAWCQVENERDRLTYRLPYPIPEEPQ